MPSCRKPNGVGVFKRLAISAALCAAFMASPAHADPISAAIVAAIGITGTAAAVATVVLTAALTYLATSAVGAVFGGGGAKQADILRELQQPTSLPLYRFVYGNCRAAGTPAPIRVKGSLLYCCYILNSRPSAGPFTLLLDKRIVNVTGDPYDFTGSGAIASNAPFAAHCRYWIGRGDQTGPPAEFLSGAPEYFQASDAWAGKTVIWLLLAAGKSEDRQQRWPATPPEVMVDGLWSLVRDPRNPSAPPAWSANQALCALDALRENPLRPYDDRNLWLDTFSWAADVADSPFPVKAGGTIPRFQVNGILVFRDGSEIEDQVAPLTDAGASRLTRVGGRLGIIPAVYSEPVMTITDVLGDEPMTFDRYRPSSELVTEVTATYTSPERTYEDASTPAYTLVGAQIEDGGPPKLGQYNLHMITDYRQAQYVAAIMGRRTRMQRSWNGMLGAEAFDLVAGSSVTMSLPAPYTHRNGIYEIESIHPGGDPVGQSGFAMRCAAQMRETSPTIYAWNPAVDELSIATGDFDPNLAATQPPGPITAISDATTVLVTGGAGVARVRFSFDPSPSPSVIMYEWQWAAGSDPWQAGGGIEGTIRDDVDKVFGFLIPVVVGVSYRIQVRGIGTGGGSEWVISDPVVGSVGPALAPAPEAVSADGGAGEITVTFQAPNSSGYSYMEIWGSDTPVIGGASLLFGPIYGSANSTTVQTETGLGSAVTRYYFGRSFDMNGSPSSFSSYVSATTD